MKLRDVRKVSRRGLLTAVLTSLSQATPLTHVSSVRCYTATATVTLLGIALVTRKAAASGFVRISEIGDARLLEFGAGSHPESCAGLNRLGYVRELVRAGENGTPSFRTFGFITSSKEESLKDARKALHETGELRAYTILDSVGDHSGRQSAVAAIPCSTSLRWPDWPTVEAELMKLWPASQKRISRLDGQWHGFLFAVRQAMRQGGSGRTDYAHNDKAYHLDWSTKPASNGLTEMHGLITSAGRESGSKSKFRLWYDANRSGEPPVSFEYQPRAFLRVLFEVAPGESLPRLAQSFRQSSATGFVTREKP